MLETEGLNHYVHDVSTSPTPSVHPTHTSVSKRRVKTKVDKEDIIGRLIHYSSLFIPIILIQWSVLEIAFHGLYSYIYPPGWTRAIIHSVSLLSLSASFLVIYSIMGYLYPLTRLIVTSVFTNLSIHIYDFTWSFSSYVVRGRGLSLIAAIAILILSLLLERLSNKHGVFDINFFRGDIINTREVGFIALILIYVLSFVTMSCTGFYQAMTLYTTTGGPDPNVGNIWWLIGKVVVFWLPLPLIDRRDLKVPLRLDPRVLVW